MDLKDFFIHLSIGGFHVVVLDKDQIVFASDEQAVQLKGELIGSNRCYSNIFKKWFDRKQIIDAKTNYIIEFYYDISSYIKENTELKYDALTGLYNRHGILEQLKEFSKTIQHEEFVVIIGDIDLFKDINDTYGHSIGDKVLKEVGSILSKTVTNGFCGRYGGEEFLIVLDTDDMHLAYQNVEMIRQTLEKTEFKIGKTNIHLTMSFGLSKYRRTNCQFEDNTSCISHMIKAADIALMESKRSGRNKSLIYDDQMKKEIE